MPEANVLYTVTAVVVAALVAWVLASLKMAKQPWPRPEAVAAIAAAKNVKHDDADVPVEKTEEKPADSASATPSASDDTAESTRVKIEDKEEPKAEEKAALEEEEKAEEKKSEA